MIAIKDATGPELSFLTGSTLATPYAPSAVRSRASQAGETAISTITIDGTLTDWTPAQRLDNRSVAGFALYGDVQAANFVFGIGDDSGTIGPGTTIWLDTDLNSTTGYQVFGNTVGAEYNIYIGTDNTPRLYSGSAGQTLIGTLNYARSSDGHGFEVAVPESLVGNATAANVFADVNHTTFLPGAYSSGGYRVGSLTSTVVGSITIDGSLTDWTPAERLDNGSITGFALYGDVQAANFVFGIGDDSGTIGPGTTIWLDTDLNSTTGYQVFGNTVGAEYNIYIGTDGVARLYSGSAGRTLIGTLNYARSSDGHGFEVAVPESLVGNATAANVFANVNNTTFLPSAYSSGGYRVGSLTSTVVGSITIDGTLTDWTPAQRLDNGSVAGFALYADVQAANFVFGIGDDSGTIGPGTTIWLDTDLNSTTGYQVFGNTVGAEYNIDIGTDGVARLYSGGAGQTLIGTLNYAVSSDGHGFEVAVPESLIGNATAANVFANVDNTTFLPGAYSSGGYRVGSLTSTVVGSITIDGSLSDWKPAERLDNGSITGYAFYGDVQAANFVFAIKDDVGKVGPGTTIWLDTDLNPATGYQVFGNTVGAEYNIYIGTDNTPRLYSGAAGQTFVGNLAYNYSADRKSIEIALPESLVGSAAYANVFADVNHTAYLPGAYSSGGYQVAGLTVSTATRIAIVYSGTSAANFYSKTAYGQLFLAAQDQAMQAGIPFDLLTESDLKDPAKLVNYKAIVFPGLANVKAADLSTITSALTIASKTYGVGLIAAGNFLTNDEKGAPFAGDSYARMKSLLGVTFETSGATSGIRLVADAGTNPILDGYTQGETVGDYSNISYQSFTDVTGTGQVLFDQIAGGATHSAVIATTPASGGRNVSFASDAIMGNNNILQKAIDWVAEPTSTNVKLSMTRFNSLFVSRSDLDQAMETSDVSGTQPGIYDKMVPIIQQWKHDYNFVGSFYIDIGDNPPDQVTDWTKSAP